MTVGELRERMDSQEFAGWLHLLQLEAEERAGRRAERLQSRREKEEAIRLRREARDAARREEAAPREGRPGPTRAPRTEDGTAARGG